MAATRFLLLVVVCATCAYAVVLEDAEEWKLWKEVTIAHDQLAICKNAGYIISVHASLSTMLETWQGVP